MYSVVLMMAVSGGVDLPDRCRRGCCGCYCSCYSGCYGGCHGGCHGCWGGMYAGCWGCHGSMHYGPGQRDYRQPGMEKSKKTSSGPAPATLIVQVPADATVTIDDSPTRSVSGTRVFVTPPLAQNTDYSYTVKAQVRRDGQVRSETRQVTVRGGEETLVTLNIAPAQSGSAASR